MQKANKMISYLNVALFNGRFIVSVNFKITHALTHKKYEMYVICTTCSHMFKQSRNGCHGNSGLA